MSEYQYYEFCRLHSPMSKEAREVMHALSSRAKVGTHNATYIYNYTDFRGDEKKLLLDYFDVFFYVSNWGSLRLMFKYSIDDIDLNAIKAFDLDHTITSETHDHNFLLDVNLNNENYSGGWVEGEGMLADLLPLYVELKSDDYRFLEVSSALHEEFYNGHSLRLQELTSNRKKLSNAQVALLEYAIQ